MNFIKPICLFVLLALASFPAWPAEDPTMLVFKQLSGLVGGWAGKSPSGRENKVNYRLTAGGTVLVETWSLSSGRESMTMYHIDGETLIATHYCPQGNQPRLVLMPDDEKLSFAFHDGTNLHIPGKAHQYSFWLKIIDGEHFQRNEIYVENNVVIDKPPVEDPQETFSYTRISAPTSAEK
ncbi:MAG: hypothetical protein ACREO1_07445 [Arenimonas sp.]